MNESLETLRARHRHQSAVAALALAALGADDLDVILDEAARVVAKILGTARSAVLERADDGPNRVRLRAGVGWPEGQLDASPFDLDLHASNVIHASVRGRDARPWGMVSAHAAGARAFLPEEAAFLEDVAGVLTLVVERHERAAAQRRENTQLLENESRARAVAESTLDRLRTIQAITDAALAHLTLDAMLGELLARLRRALGADNAGIQLLDEESQMLYTGAIAGEIPENFRNIRVPLGSGISGRIVRDGRPLVVDDMSTIDYPGLKGISVPAILAISHSVMGVPLRVGDKVLGSATVNSRRPRHFTEEELDLLLIVADRMAPAIERARLIETIRAGEDRQKALARRLMTAQEEERRRVAIELHDELGQVLTAVKINLGSLDRVSAGPTERARLQDATQGVDRAMEGVRNLALDLRPSVLDDLGLPAALRWYVDRFARTVDIHAQLSIGAVPDLEPSVATACFRVAQEALTNVARHAQARDVWLDLQLVAGGLELRIRDDGVGFDVAAARKRASAGASMGLLGMQERAALAGGDFELRSLPHGGTELRARFPVGGPA
jgi:signal transduction histidine kinase